MADVIKLSRPPKEDESVPNNAALFIVAQFAGALASAALFGWPYRRERDILAR